MGEDFFAELSYILCTITFSIFIPNAVLFFLAEVSIVLLAFDIKGFST